MGTQVKLSKAGSGREILSAALKDAMNQPLFINAAERKFCETPHIEENQPLQPKQTKTTNVQTDKFLARPAPKALVPQKVGFDSAVQVDTAAVFDFDYEVAPMVNSLVSKIVEQVTMELEEEATLAKIRTFKTAAAQRRDAEISAWEASVAAEAARRAEAERQAAALDAVRAKNELLRRREYFRQFAAEFLGSLVPDTLAMLRRDFGVFENEKVLEIERKFLPDLVVATQTVLFQQQTACALADALLRVGN